MAKKDLLVKMLDSMLDHATARQNGGGQSSFGEFRPLPAEELIERLGMTQVFATPIEQLSPTQRSRCETLVLLLKLHEEGKPYGEIVHAIKRVKKGLASMKPQTQPERNDEYALV